MEAPVSASQGAMRSLPMKLESFLSVPENGLWTEEKEKLRILQGELQGLIHNYLLEPSEVESPASTASSWMEGVPELSYDIDDFIYELAHVAGGGARINVVHKLPRFKISRFPEKLRRRQWITDEISAFRTRVQEAIRRHRDYLGSNCKWRPSSSCQHPPASLPSGEAATHLVGVDSSIKQLRGWLGNDGRPEHKVASIVGPAGVGKTTLAKQVYRMLGGQFDCRAFMRTSRKPEMKGLLTNILSQVRQHRLPDDDPCDVHDLVLSINAHLQDKTYLIIIEDLWSLSTWDLINRSLPKGNRCSRILTTTEVEVIAQACCADNFRYIIKKEPLSEDESTELFLSTAFGKQAECPQQLKEVSNEIIKRSGGLPLAINVLASLFARRQLASSIEQWNYIKNSLSSTLTTNDSLERINQVLNLGYDNLPHGMKACILYLCLYEEGCIVWKDDLVKQWIAEGFIGTVKVDEEEEVARSYFDELVNRGMIQPMDINCDDEILSCTVHHMVLYFIRDKSMEDNFCIAVDHSQTTIRLADKVRRLALHFGNVEDATSPGPESMRLSKVRSVAFSGFLKCMPSIVDFRFLQVLILKFLVQSDKVSDNLTGSGDLSGSITEPDDLSDILTQPGDLSYNLTEISELFRLRYFRLDACHMSVALPTKMQQLKNLVAWEIDAEVIAVPSDIVDLPCLLYLRIPSEAGLPDGIGRMTSLRTLGVLDLSKNSTETIMSLGELTNLQELHLTCSTLQPGNLGRNLECLGMIVQKLRNLKRVTLVPAVSSLVNTQDDRGSSSMSISWLGFSIQPIPPVLQTLELSRRCCIFSSLPEWTNELTNLRILKIAVRELSRGDVAILKGLPSLAALSLFISTAPASSIMFDDEGFLVLKYFKFVCAAPCLAFSNGAMPEVRKVKLGFNANRMKGYSLDDVGFEHLMGLTEISIKIRGTGADEHNMRSTQLVLTNTIGKDPRTSTINVQWVDWDFLGDEDMYIEAQKEMGKWTSAKQGMTAGGGSDEHEIQEKNLEEDANKQANTRTDMPPESTLHPRNTDGIAKKHKVDSFGYGEMYKPYHHPEKEKRHPMQYLLEKMSSSDAQSIKLQLLKTITEDFSEKMKIGSGSYGEVYKGVLNGDEIAVKKLFPVYGLDDEAFENEFCNLKKVQHKNVIRMIGYCYEIAHKDVEYQGKLVWSQVIDRALCFEYMKGGSLAKHICAESCVHDWPITYKIIKGTCEGLHHLHKGGEKKIFHLDLKPDNVLLDEELVPKIGDFGLSELFGSPYTHQLSSTKGTIGFMPQEYIHNRKVSPKNDVFSLGVIIFHIMAGEKGYGDYWDARRRPNFSSKIQQEFIESVQEYWKKKMQRTEGYRWDETDLLGVTRCIDMAMRCVEDDRDERPYIKDIINELNKLDCEVTEMLKNDPKPPIGQLKRKNCVSDLEAVKQNKSLNALGKDIVVDPSLELCFPFEPNKDIRCCLQLINKGESSHIAFNINTDVNKYRAQPNKGIIAPYSKRYITLTLRAQEKAPPNMQCADVLVVRGIRVSEHFTSDEITQDYLKKTSAVYEVTLPIVYVALDHKPLSQ